MRPYIFYNLQTEKARVVKFLTIKCLNISIKVDNGFTLKT